MWLPYWKLTHDPFLDEPSPFVRLDPHREAVARLVDTIDSGRKRAILREPAGLGKSRVLSQAIAEARRPGRRFARLAGAADGATLYATLAETLGTRVPAGASRSDAWRALREALRVCRWQRLHVILAMDDCQLLDHPDDQRDLERLLHVDSHPASRVTVVQVYRSDEEPAHGPESWELAIRLRPLTRTECEHYVTTRLAAVGRPDSTFTPRALDRLHAHSRGVPRSVNGLGTLALMAGAMRGMEIVTPDLIEGVALEGVWSRAAG